MICLIHARFHSEARATAIRVQAKLSFFEAAIDFGLLNPTPKRVCATSNFRRNRHIRRRLIGIRVFMFQNHPNRAGTQFSQNQLALLLFFMGSINTHFRACGKLRAVDRSHSASFPGMWVSTAQVSSPWVNALKSRLDARDGRFWSACVTWFHPQSIWFL